MPRVLFAGESWFTHHIHIKGFDSFEDSSYHEGGTELIRSLRDSGIEVEYQPSHIAAERFPFTLAELQRFDAVLLSDIGANTLLLPQRTFAQSHPSANRLDLLKTYVEGGGGLLMIGGYLTFQGIQAKGCWHGTLVEAVLPVVLSATDDRCESPQGVWPTIADPSHPVMRGLENWPRFLGYNRATLHPEATLLASVGDDPFVAVRSVGKGRSAIFASDCGPHWGPPEFQAWPGYGRLWTNLVRWLSGAGETEGA
jgi:uncharacterized membrane protein